MKKHIIHISYILLLISVVCLLYAYFAEPYLIEEKQVTLESSDIPPSFDGKRIVFVSDIHTGPFFQERGL